MKALRRFALFFLILSLPLIAFAQDDDGYEIKIGESIQEIALNLNVDVMCLMSANDITNPSFITPGDVLTVPEDCSLLEAETVTEPEEIEGEIYVVSAGQTLTDIAFELLVDLNCLIETNSIDNISDIAEGDELIIAEECLLIGGSADDNEDEIVDIPAESAEEAVPLGETTETTDSDTDTDTDTDSVADDDADDETETEETETTTETTEETADTVTNTDDETEAVTEETEADDSALGQGGGAVDESTETTSAIIPIGEYVVQRGDTLARIANNANATVACLLRTNRNITDADLIYAGQVITISTACVNAGQGGGGIVVDETDAGRVCRGDRNPGRTTNNGVYVVQVGDMLDFIGCDFGLQTACLAEVNDLNPPGAIEIGQSLIIDFSCPAWDGPPGPGDLDN